MRNYLLPLFVFLFVWQTQAQYISRSQPFPFNCPTVCPGSVLVLDVPQVQGLNNGDTIQVWLSNASGSFASGTTTLNSTAYSLNTGTTWTSGAYTYSADVNNLYLEVTIPANLPAGTAYTIYMKTSAGYVAADLFQCSGSNYITVISAYPTLAPLAANSEGNGVWDASVYTWVPTTNGIINTTALVNAQDFFDPANYKGYFIKDSLSFDIDYSAFGGSCPGTPGVLNDGTSIPCSAGYQSNFSIMMKRRQNFAPGLYNLSIQSDDGMRLSIDGGNTWILSCFFEQTYDTSFRTTTTTNPAGICLSGPVDLVIEYFQHPAQTHFTFTCTPLATVTLPPTSQTICAGANASFNITAPGTTTYQWLYSTNNGVTYTQVPNSAPFGGVTSNDLTISSTPANFTGYLFECQIGGLCGGLDTTSPDTLYVSGGSITTQPVNVSVCAGNTAWFAIGGGSSYQWQVNTGSGFVNVTNAAPYSGSTSDTLKISAVTAGMSGYQYQCLVTGCGGAPVTSNTVILSIGASASITTQPVDTSVCAGGAAGFNMVAQNAASYQWQVNTGSGFVNVTNSAPYSGATGASLSISPVTMGMNGYRYQCVITGCGGASVITNTATLSLGAGATIAAQPQSASVCPGSDASFNITAQNASTYQWQVNTGTGYADVTNASPYSGAFSATLTVSPVSAGMSGYQYQCVITGCGGASVTSSPATLSLGAAAAISSQPSDTGVCSGNNVSFAVVAQNTVSYQWQVNTGAGFVNITNNAPYSGATGPVLSITAATAGMNGYTYQCIITGCAGAMVTSNVATLTVSNGATIVNQPVDTTICVGDGAAFSISTSAATTYQWQVNSGGGFVNITDGNVYSNTAGTALQVTVQNANMNGYQYRCVIVGCGGVNVNSLAATLHVNGAPVITMQPADVSVCQPANVSFSTAATGYNLTFQWQLSTDGGTTYTDINNGLPYTGAQTGTLAVANADKTFAGYFYRCVATACSEPAISAVAEILTCPNPLNLFIPNVFTPNGDGHNDVFAMYYSGPDLIYSDLRIFNRWGEKVFESNNINIGWDGTYKSVKQEPGVYTYTVTLLFSDKQDAVHKKGTIMLLR